MSSRNTDTHLQGRDDDDERESSPLANIEDGDDNDMASYVPDNEEDDDDEYEDAEDRDDDDAEAEDVEEVSDLMGTVADLFGPPAGADPQNANDSGDEEIIRIAPSRNALLALLYRYGRNIGTFGRERAPRQPEHDTEEDIRDPAGWSVEKGGYKDSKVSDPRGLRLLRSGEFGPIAPVRYEDEKRSAEATIPRMVQHRRNQTRRLSRDEFSRHLIPNTHGTTVATYDAKAYVGQFSAGQSSFILALPQQPTELIATAYTDSSFYYTCCQDFRLHIYDTSVPPISVPRSRLQPRWDRGHNTTMKVQSSIDGMPGQWTITDSHLNADNSALIYSSLTSTVYMTNPHDPAAEQIPIPFGGGRTNGYDSHFALYSCRFSTSGTEIIAGGNGQIFVYDLGAMRRSLRINAHDDDINSCCWADTTSGNVLVSASDDTSLKVWDRRSLGGGGEKPSGVLIGHTEGITHVSPKGDGRYVISNGKDQVLRLWDLRKMRTHQEWKGQSGYNLGNWDYRSLYPKPYNRGHPLDTSVMQYKGHAIMRTLIRCHFSPQETTGQSYIYSGSADGLIHIWSLDGRVVQVLDRSKTLPITFDASAPDQPERSQSTYRGACCVRDVAWHTYEPVLMSTAWASMGMEESSIARHEWKGYGKNAMTVEDVLERDRLHETEWAGLNT
ncbi:hypothetical protein FRB96_006976 [Tulasnella sp. 330]|nr:hypothetical protein FRB96_006976 [Tulasnella sp. 330]KAG8883816.1 hypothetical protein FRB97_005819 [Tulasnella sp. 331]